MRDDTSEELRRLGIESIKGCNEKGKLYWLGNLERKNENDCVKLVQY